jgi:prepilin-type N-terminal cleavage/methylation domain-containing protein
VKGPTGAALLRRHPGTQRLRPFPRPIRAFTRAFTLVELLVVIGIVGVLAGILIPVLGSARASSQNVTCLSNLRQMMMGFHLYAADNRDTLPDPLITQQSWESLLKTYLPGRDSFRCPSDGSLFENLRSSYDWRDTPDRLTTLAGKTFSEIRRTSAVFVFDALPDWHRKGKINVAQADGSVQTMDHQECLKDLDISIYEFGPSPKP